MACHRCADRPLAENLLLFDAAVHDGNVAFVRAALHPAGTEGTEGLPKWIRQRALETACQRGNYPLVLLLLAPFRQGDDPVNIHYKHERALFLAAEGRTDAHQQIVADLLRRGARPQDMHAWPPIHPDRLRIIQALLDAGLDPNANSDAPVRITAKFFYEALLLLRDLRAGAPCPRYSLSGSWPRGGLHPDRWRAVLDLLFLYGARVPDFIKEYPGQLSLEHVAEKTRIVQRIYHHHLASVFVLGIRRLEKLAQTAARPFPLLDPALVDETLGHLTPLRFQY